MNDIQEEIFRSIESIAKTNSSPALLDIPTIIIGVERGNKYKVKIDGAERMAKDGIGLNLKVGDAVWVHLMNGDFSELYVMCRR